MINTATGSLKEIWKKILQCLPPPVNILHNIFYAHTTLFQYTHLNPSSMDFCLHTCFKINKDALVPHCIRYIFVVLFLVNGLQFAVMLAEVFRMLFFFKPVRHLRFPTSSCLQHGYIIRNWVKVHSNSAFTRTSLLACCFGISKSPLQH